MRGGDHVGVGLGVGGGVGRSGRIEPVAELEAARPQGVVTRQRGGAVDPRAHARQLAREQPEIAAALVDDPRHERRGVAPARGGRARVVEHVGDDERHRAVGVLLGRQVGQPRAEESGRVEQERRRRGEDLDVAGPAEPLVALRAVGGHVEEVAAHAPHDVLVEPVEPLVGGAEPAGAPEVGADDDGLDVLGAHLDPGDLRVAEAVEGEARLEHLDTAGQDVAVGGLGRAQRADAELTVLEHLGVTDRDLGAGVGIAHGQSHPADQVLAEVDERRAGRGAEDLVRVERLRRPHRRPVGGDEAGESRLAHPHRVAAVASRRPEVGALAVVEVVGEDAALARGPGLVGGEHVDRAVGGRHLQLREQRQPVPVHRPPVAPTQPAPEPPVAEQHLELRSRPRESGR